MSLIAMAGGATGTGTVTLLAPVTNTDRTLTLPDATGTLILSGTTPSLNGVSFPATQVPSADANTLDDYEEGTWTPVLTVGFTAVGATTLTGTYTKIGRIVFVRGTLQAATSLTSAGGNTRVTGMPFTSTTSCPVVFARDDLNYPGTGFFDGTTSGLYNPAYSAGTSTVIFTFFYIV